MTTPPDRANPSLSVTQQVQSAMVRELFTRSGASDLMVFLPVLLLAWTHWGAQPAVALVQWSGGMCMVLLYRFVLARQYLAHSRALPQGGWLVLEWLGAVALGLGLVASLLMLGGELADALLHLRLVFLVGMASFAVSAIAMHLRICISFLLVLTGGGLWALHLRYPQFMQGYWAISMGLPLYALMLLVRSRGEQQRRREWVMARLEQKRLLDLLNAQVVQERLVAGAMRDQSLAIQADYEQLSERSSRDALTQAYNHGHIEAQLRLHIASLQRRHEDFSVLMMDIDHFKQVNDQHGHLMGDQVLRQLAARVQCTLRQSDLFGRWGGEEFMVLLPHTSQAAAQETAERLRQEVKSMVFESEAGPFGITISIGVAQLQPDEAADALVARVDAAMYAAKHAGRDCVRVA